ncbi:MAG: hypothetical protein WCJ37_01910 [Syntrophus sp. (in: bacteria)]
MLKKTVRSARLDPRQEIRQGASKRYHYGGRSSHGAKSETGSKNYKLIYLPKEYLRRVIYVACNVRHRLLISFLMFLLYYFLPTIKKAGQEKYPQSGRYFFPGLLLLGQRTTTVLST